MKFNVVGSDPRTGRTLRMVVDAADLEEAASTARRRQIAPTSVTFAAEPEPRAIRVTATSGPGGPLRKIVGAVALVAPFFIAHAPVVPAIVGGALVAAVGVFVLVPSGRGIVRHTLGVFPERPVRGVFKLVLASLWGAFLLILALGGSLMRVEKKRAEAQQRERTAQREGEVSTMLANVEEALRNGDLPTTTDLTKLAAAAAVNHPGARELKGKIERSTSEESVHSILCSLPEPDFKAFREAGTIPGALEFGYPALDARALELARGQVEQASEAREKNRAESEALMAERRRRVDAETAQQNPGRGDPQQKLDAYRAALAPAGSSVVEDVSVRSLGDAYGWEATVTVSNLWHFGPRQVRLQNAQALWRIWANVACPSSPDNARLSIVDLMGNEVGGSRVWAGSLIWVDD